MTLLDFTPTKVDLKLYAGDDVTIRLFLSTDAPAGASFVGTWDATVHYTVNQIVEYSSVFYTAILPSLDVLPTAADHWTPITPLDLTGYTAWAAQIRSSDTQDVAFTVDDTLQTSSIISLSIAGTILTAQQSLGAQSWDLQVVDPNSDIRTFFQGSVTILADATRP